MAQFGGQKNPPWATQFTATAVSQPAALGVQQPSLLGASPTIYTQQTALAAAGLTTQTPANYQLTQTAALQQQAAAAAAALQQQYSQPQQALYSVQQQKVRKITRGFLPVTSNPAPPAMSHRAPSPSPPVEEREGLTIEDNQPRRRRRPRHRRAHNITWGDIKNLQDQAARMAPEGNPSAGTLFLLMCAIITANSQARAQHVWAAISHPGVLMPVSADSLQFPAVRVSNCSVGLPCDGAEPVSSPWNGTVWANISSPNLLKWTLDNGTTLGQVWIYLAPYETGDFYCTNHFCTEGVMLGLNATFPLALSSWTRVSTSPSTVPLCPYLFLLEESPPVLLPSMSIPWVECLRASQPDTQTDTLGIWGRWLRKGMTPFALRDPIRRLHSQFGRWDLCGPNACIDQRAFTGLRGARLYNGTWKKPASRWENNIAINPNATHSFSYWPCVRPPLLFLTKQL